MSTVVPGLAGVSADEPKIRLLDQRRRLKGLSRLLRSQRWRGEPAQLIINERQKLFGRVRVAVLDRGQDAADIGHDGEDTARVKRRQHAGGGSGSRRSIVVQDR